MYLDRSDKVYPVWRRDAVQSQSTDFDADADGVQDSMGQLATKWANGRAVLTSRLRQELGHAVYLVANTAGPLGDHNLNGITLEGVGTTWTVAQGRLFLMDQKRVAQQPFVAAAWVLSAECVAATRSLVLQVPGTCYGRVSVDRARGGMDRLRALAEARGRRRAVGRLKPPSLPGERTGRAPFPAAPGRRALDAAP
jgi:hypothetical protein